MAVSVLDYPCRRYFGYSYREMVKASMRQFPNKCRIWHYRRIDRMVGEAIKDPPPPKFTRPYRMILAEEPFLEHLNVTKRKEIP